MRKLPKLSAMPAAVAIPRNKTTILPFILLVLVVLFECGKKITPKRLLIVWLGPVLPTSLPGQSVVEGDLRDPEVCQG